MKEENQKPKVFHSTQKQFPLKQKDSNGAVPSGEIASNIFQKPNNVVAIPNNFSNDFKELDEKVNSMMKKSENLLPNGQRKAHICKVCGKEGMGNDIKKHIEANHLEGVSIPCNFCERTFRSRKSLREHNIKYHK